MNLRELAETALGVALDCGGTADGGESLARSQARNALFAAIEQCEKDAALGRDVRAVVEMDGDLGLFASVDGIMAGDIDACAPNRPVVAPTLDEAVAALRERLSQE